MYLRLMSGDLPFGPHSREDDPCIVGPFESQAQLDAFCDEVGRYWRTDGAFVFTPQQYLEEFRRRNEEEAPQAEDPFYPV